MLARLGPTSANTSSGRLLLLGEVEARDVDLEEQPLAQPGAVQDQLRRAELRSLVQLMPAISAALATTDIKTRQSGQHATASPIPRRFEDAHDSSSGPCVPTRLSS